MLQSFSCKMGRQLSYCNRGCLNFNFVLAFRLDFEPSRQQCGSFWWNLSHNDQIITTCLYSIQRIPVHSYLHQCNDLLYLTWISYLIRHRKCNSPVLAGVWNETFTQLAMKGMGIDSGRVDNQKVTKLVLVYMRKSNIENHILPPDTVFKNYCNS